MTPWWKNFQNMTKKIFPNKYSSIYNDLLLLTRAIKKIHINQETIELPNEWENLSSNIIFYEQFRNSKSSLIPMSEYLERASSCCEELQKHFVNNTQFNDKNITDCLNKLSNNIKQELSKHKKKLK